jgi:phosphoserine phosphatase RsbU/P
LKSPSFVEEPGSIQVWTTERDEARQIQQSLLPAGTLHTPACEVACRFSPFFEVGGDFADFFQLPDGHVGLYVGDVVGKGLPAAMYAALVMGMLRGIHKREEDTASALALLNQRMLVRPVPGRYSATLYALFDPASRQLVFSNAGLPFPLLVSESGCARLGQGGLPSGLLPDSRYEACSVHLSPGDSVLFATDGLYELRDRHGNDFGWDRLGEVWSRCRHKTAQDSLAFLFEEAHQFAAGGRQEDDITAVVLKVTEA